jgi:hypothetical protein
VARTFSAEEIAAEAGVPQDRVAWLVSIGIVKPSQSGALRFGDVFRVKLVSALLGAGLTEAILERATAEGWLNLDHVDAYLPNEPSPTLESCVRRLRDLRGANGVHPSVRV